MLYLMILNDKKANSVRKAQCAIEAGISSDDVTGSHYTEYRTA